VHAVGIGFGQLILLSLVAIYYNMIIAWTLFYLFESFIHITNLPWAHCFNEWNTFCQFADIMLSFILLSAQMQTQHIT